MTKQNTAYDDLKHILLSEEIENQQELMNKIDELRKEIKERERLDLNVGPLIEERLEEMRVNFPAIYGEVITKTIKKQISESRDEMVDALYPIIGKLIKKFIQKEIELLVERFENQIDKSFNIKRLFKKRRTKEDKAAEAFTDAMPPTLNDVFVIENGSGLLMGSYSKHQVVDKDMIAAMLTAIKSFVEDAFSNRNQSLEWIEYETYKIYIITFKRLSIACTISGVPNKQYKTELEDQVLEFVKEVLPKLTEDDQGGNMKIIESQLTEHFQYF
jgi:hypothetical protein